MKVFKRIICAVLIVCMCNSLVFSSAHAEEYTNTVNTNIVITAQPVSATVAVGVSAKFRVKATGENLSYLWQYKLAKSERWVDWTAKTSTSLSVPYAANRDGMNIRCRITDATGYEVYTDVVTLNYEKEFAITEQPVSTVVPVGSSAMFSVKAIGEGLTYLWQYKKSGSRTWVDWTSKTTSSISVAYSAKRDGMSLRCCIVDSAGEEHYTDEVTLSYGEIDPIRILQQPESLVVDKGAAARFEVKAEGEGLSYLWRYKLAGSNTWVDWTTKTTAAISAAYSAKKNGMSLKCLITDAEGHEIETDVVTLYYGSSLVITTPPTDQTIDFGGETTLSIEATGENLSYTWYINGVEYANANSYELTVDRSFISREEVDKAFLQGAKIAVYCVVSDGTNSVSSDVVSVTVNGCNHEKVYELLQTTAGRHAVICDECNYETEGNCVWDNFEPMDDNTHVVYCSCCYAEGTQEMCEDSDEDGWCDRCGGEYQIPLQFVNPSPAKVEVNARSTVQLSAPTNKDADYCWYEAIYDFEEDEWYQTEIDNANSDTIDYCPAAPGSYRVIAEAYYEDEIISYAFEVESLGMTANIYECLTNGDVLNGSTHTLRVGAEGDGITYQWYESVNYGAWNLLEVDGPTYTKTFNADEYMENEQYYVNYQYRVEVIDMYGNCAESDCFIWVVPALRIIMPTKSTTIDIYEGFWIDLCVDAIGYNLKYRWMVSKDGGASWSSVPGGTWPQLNFRVLNDGYKYKCRVTDQFGNKKYSKVYTVNMYPGFEIISNPEDQIVREGDTVVFETEAEGIGLTYQWYYYQGEINGATDAKLVLQNVSVDDSGLYYCMINDAEYNQATTDCANLQVVGEISITDPENVTASVGDYISFGIETTGNAASFQWQMKAPGSEQWRNATLSGAKSPSVFLRAFKKYDGFEFRCLVTDYLDKLYVTEAATLTVRQELAIIEQPDELYVYEGEEAVLTFAAVGEGLTYQWYKIHNGRLTELKGENQITLIVDTTLPDGTPTHDSYFCIVLDKYGYKTETQWATVNVSKGITILSQPENVQSVLGQSVNFSLEAEGNNLSYQWQVSLDNGNTWRDCGLYGSMSPDLWFAAREEFDGALFRCYIWNEDYSATSDEVSLNLYICEHDKTTVTVLGNGSHRFSCAICSCEWDEECYAEENSSNCAVCGRDMNTSYAMPSAFALDANGIVTMTIEEPLWHTTMVGFYRVCDGTDEEITVLPLTFSEGMNGSIQTFNFSNYITETGTYYIKVRTERDCYFDEAWNLSNAPKSEEVYCVVGDRLDTPEVVIWSDSVYGRGEWCGVDGADLYMVTLYCDDYINELRFTSDTYFDFYLDGIYASSARKYSYTFTVTALSNNLSEMAGSFESEKSDILTPVDIISLSIFNRSDDYVYAETGNETVLAVEAEGVELTYTWYKNGELITEGIEGAELIFTPEKEGSYDYCCEVRDAYGNSEIVNFNVEVIDGSPIAESPFIGVLYDSDVSAGSYVYFNAPCVWPSYSSVTYYWEVSYDEGANWSVAASGEKEEFQIRATLSCNGMRIRCHAICTSMFGTELFDGRSNEATIRVWDNEMCQHVDGTASSSEAGKHIYECSDCGIALREENCSFNGDHTCVVCGYTCDHSIKGHTIASDIQGMHMHICDICGYESEGGCMDENQDNSCDACGAVMSIA